MKARIKLEKVDLNILLHKLKEISTVNEDKRVSYDAFEYDDLSWLFLSLTDFGNLYNIESKKEILSKTFEQLVLDNKFDKTFFFETLNEKIIEHNRKQEKVYSLLTSLSIKELPLKKINIDDCQIVNTGKMFPKKFRGYRSQIFEFYNKTHEESDYLKIVVSTKARDFRDAYEKAFRSLEVFRAILCLLLNSKKEMVFASHSLKPINKVRQGEFSSLHVEDGSCAKKNYAWHEPYFKVAELVEFSTEKRIALKSSVKRLVKKFNMCSPKHRQTIGKALIMYVSAFDESNKYLCFLRAWTVLETVLNTDQNDIIIKRYISLYGDNPQKAFQKQIMEGLRNYRNKFVHEGNDVLDPFIACFHTQEMIYNLIIRFNFRYAGFFNTIEESSMFLENYTPLLQELRIRKKILDKVIDLKEKQVSAKKD